MNKAKRIEPSKPPRSTISKKRVEPEPTLKGERNKHKTAATKKTGLSILIIGSTGPTGLACLRRLSRHKGKKELHIFCRDSSKISKEDKSHCKSIVEGDARRERDIKTALKQTKANIVLVSIGNNNNDHQRSDIRTASATALVNVMTKKKFRHVRALVISRLPNLPIKTSPRRCRLLERIQMSIQARRMRFVLMDHAGQEEVCLSLKDRITIVRPTSLKDTQATGKIQEFRLEDKPTSYEIPRDDLASWIAGELCCGFSIGGRVANITGG